ncbi:DUF6446 family protein [Shimia abyssi]|uniref:Histidine kinase n=1 Tax=Shimia abyssi TaxID=1662395 RepID=A0A2P8FAY1_9RHOB|nr:DUF6446 family protein [Shimia abyssi]PSL18848.1 hypothetical protein CLV88_10826 [Shimia abyssi]
MSGKIFASFVVVTAIVAGIAMYWLQVYAYYDEVPVTGTDDVQMTSQATKRPEAVSYEAFQAIDSDSSPIRYRACFTTSMSVGMMTETYVTYENPEPLVAPKWFDCFDAKEVGFALEEGEALAFMGTENVLYGIDRVVAVLPDGRGFVWHQINKCGEVVFDGKRAPEGCPPKPGE